MPCGREPRLQRLPETEGTLTNRQFRCDGQAAGFAVDQQLAPALRALAHADLKAQEFLLALWRGADQHQHAFGLWLQAGLQVDSICPDVDVMAGRQVTPLPARVVRLPLAL